MLKQVFGTDGISFHDCGVKLPAGSTCADQSPVLRPRIRSDLARHSDLMSLGVPR